MLLYFELVVQHPGYGLYWFLAAQLDLARTPLSEARPRQPRPDYVLISAGTVLRHGASCFVHICTNNALADLS